MPEQSGGWPTLSVGCGREIADDVLGLALRGAVRADGPAHQEPVLARADTGIDALARVGEARLELVFGHQQLTIRTFPEPTRSVVALERSLTPAAVTEVHARPREIQQELLLVGEQSQLALRIRELFDACDEVLRRACAIDLRIDSEAHDEPHEAEHPRAPEDAPLHAANDQRNAPEHGDSRERREVSDFVLLAQLDRPLGREPREIDERRGAREHDEQAENRTGLLH